MEGNFKPQIISTAKVSPLAIAANDARVNMFVKAELGVFDSSKRRFTASFTKQLQAAIKNIIDPVLKNKLSKTLLTKDPLELREILTPTMISSLIMAGKESTEKILFPLLYEYYNKGDIRDAEKAEMTKILRECYYQCKDMCANDFDLQRQAQSKLGVDLFYQQIHKIIKPYKLF